MSTSDRHEQGPLTRKQLREIRLTGSTPVISADEAAAAAAAPAVSQPVPPRPRPAEPVEIAPAPSGDIDSDGAPLTRRQIRELERVKTASVTVVGDQDSGSEEDAAVEEAPVEEVPVEDAIVEVVAVEETPVEEASVEVAEEAPTEDAQAAPVEELISEVPASAAPAAPSSEDDDDDDIDDQVDVAPVSAAAASGTVGDVPLAVDSAPAEGESSDADEDHVAREDELDGEGERPVVSETFGHGVLADPARPQQSFAPSFDELLSADSSGGSQHTASNALIFNPPAGEGSLDGPVASTGEILVTGSYELPRGMGSQGHAHGVTDGKDVDAVLIDGELPPASSPTPIAASAAVSTIKPSGEVIRPPAPEKGNKLMLTLAIVAGGLALALGVVLIIAFTTKLI